MRKPADYVHRSGDEGVHRFTAGRLCHRPHSFRRGQHENTSKLERYRKAGKHFSAIVMT